MYTGRGTALPGSSFFNIILFNIGSELTIFWFRITSNRFGTTRKWSIKRVYSLVYELKDSIGYASVSNITTTYMPVLILTKIFAFLTPI